MLVYVALCWFNMFSLICFLSNMCLYVAILVILCHIDISLCGFKGAWHKAAPGIQILSPATCCNGCHFLTLGWGQGGAWCDDDIDDVLVTMRAHACSCVLIQACYSSFTRASCFILFLIVHVHSEVLEKSFVPWATPWSYQRKARLLMTAHWQPMKHSCI